MATINLKLWFDRALSRGFWRQLGIMSIVLFMCYGFSCLLLSLSADWRLFCEEYDGICYQFFLPLYLLVDQNAFNSVYFDKSSTASYWLIMACGFTYIMGLVCFSGAIIAILSDFIKRRVDNYENGRTHYLKKGHYLIMGYDDIVPSIITHILKQNNKAKILVLSASPSQEIFEKLRESVARKYLHNIVINYGHRVSSDYYKDIHLESAEQIFIAGERSKPKHDAVNVECVESICAYLKNLKDHHRKYTVKRITCVFEDLDTYAAFRTTDIFTEITNDDLNIEFIPYNFYVNWARRVFVNQSYIGKADQKEHAYQCLCKNGIGLEDEHYVHLVFVGMSNFAVTFANEAANIFHFPNYKKKRTRITFIDCNAYQEMPIFITRNHHFFEVQPFYYGDFTKEDVKESVLDKSHVVFQGNEADFLDIEFEFIKGDIFSSSLQQLIEKWAKDEQQYLSVFMAMTNQRDNFAIAMNMPDAVYNKEIPVFVRQDSSDNFITHLRQADTNAPRKGVAEYRKYENGELITKEAHGRYAHIYPFGMKDTAIFADNTAFRRAKLINYLYCSIDDTTKRFPPLDKLNQTPAAEIWADADTFWKNKCTVAQKWSNLYFAYSIDYKVQSTQTLRNAGMDETAINETLGVMEHNRWNVEKLLMGYRKPKQREDMYHKPEEIAEKLKNNKHLFIHPQIRPFEELTDDMKQLDYDLAAYMPWIIEMTK